MTDWGIATASEIARAVKDGTVTAQEVLRHAIRRIEEHNTKVNAFTDLTLERAEAAARAVDAKRASGGALGALAGVPYAVKNLFDIEGLPTRAGSLINRTRPAATADAALVRKMDAADAVLTGGLNMGEYAYDFSGENAHDGASRNPHDLAHMTGGSSGGSGAAVAAGLVPVALGSDTNGSIRVPASLCGLFGLKPTFGRLSRHGTFPFAASFDHLGPLARSAADLALSYDAMQGHDPHDPFCAPRAAEPVAPLLGKGAEGLRVAVAGGYFASGAMSEAFAAVEVVAKALGAAATIEFPEAGRARAAGFLITMTEGAALHIDRLKQRPQDFDPDTRDRFLAGAMLPAVWIGKAQKFRRWYKEKVLKLFADVDLVVAPATPARAPRLGQKTFVLDGVELAVRANLGIFTQPVSFIGLPVCTVPVWTPGETLPIGVQIIAAPWREDLVLRAGHALEMAGVARAPVAKGFV